jgi:hypothetical protein
MLLTRFIFLIFGIISILFCGASPVKQKSDDTIVLRDEKFDFTPREFYISDVADERKERSSVASLININPDHSSTTKQADLKDGAVVSVKNFISHNLHRDTSLRPVMLTLKEFKITETKLADGSVSGHLAVVFSFALQLSYYTVHLVDFTGGIRYSRSGNQPVDAEAILRHGIEGVISDFNKWISANAETNATLAKAVKVHFTDYTEKPEGDTIYYSVNRPLTWADFKDRPRDNRFEAEIFASIGYIEHNEVKKGVIYVNIAMKVDVAKSDCWIRGEKDSYVLNHEQRHFDIEKLVGEHFKQKILAMNLPVDNFNGPINVEYLETLREATRMQKQYDAETHHGEDKQAQAEWNEKIDKELLLYKLKK